MTGWHVDAETVARYVRGNGPLSVRGSVESHLISCGQCRALVARSVDLDRLELVWADVVDQVDAPRPGVVERLLRLAGVSEDTARLLAATPTLRSSWLLALAAVVTFAAIASSANARGTLFFLTVAPILPVIGVAAAFHRRLDPAHEIGLAAPYSGFRLLILRSVAVTAVTGGAALGAGVLLPDRALTAAVWPLPALALTTLTLALARLVDTAYAAGGVVAAWVAAVVLSRLGYGQFAVFGAVAQLAFLGIAAACAVVLVADRDRYATRLGGAR